MDIKELLYGIKKNIHTIEEGEYDSALLDDVRADFLELLELIKLFLISERDSYYGYFLMNMQFRVNFSSNSIAGIKLNEFPPVLESNPLLLCKFTLKEILYVICHEIDHVVLNHPAEMVKSNPTNDPERFREFNLAADAAVNDRIDYEIVAEKHNFMSAPRGVITSSVLAKMYNLAHVFRMESYAYYLELITQREKPDDMPQNGQDAMMQEQSGGEGNQGEGNRGKGGDNQNKDEDGNDAQAGATSEGAEAEGAAAEGQNGSSDGNRVVTAKNCGKLSDHNWEAGDDAEDATAAARELVNAAADMMNDESRGLMPADFWSQVELINKPPVLSWQAILKKYIGTINATKRKTRMRLNRRQPERFDLSGRVDDKILKIVVAIDTSASVDDSMIARIFNEIFMILAKRKSEITVIECDADVQRVYTAKKPEDIQKKVSGRGGTQFTPAIEYINEKPYFRDALLIYFTDGFGEYEIPKPRTYRNIWVVFNGPECLSVREPYGIVLKL